MEDLGDEAPEILSPVLNCLASSTNSYIISRLLIQKARTPIYSQRRASPLYIIVLHFAKKILCQLFIEEGAQTGVQNKNGATPSHLAAMACQATREINGTFVYLAT